MLVYALQQTSKTESESYDDSYEQRLPILADLVLYYCRHAASPTLIQLYQAEVRLIASPPGGWNGFILFTVDVIPHSLFLRSCP